MCAIAKPAISTMRVTITQFTGFAINAKLSGIRRAALSGDGMLTAPELPLYTTPVVYLYLDRFRIRCAELRRRVSGRPAAGDLAHLPAEPRP